MAQIKKKNNALRKTGCPSLTNGNETMPPIISNTKKETPINRINDFIVQI